MIHDIILSSSSLLDTSLSEGMFVVYFVIFAIAFIAILISSIVTAVRRIKRNKRRDRRPPPQHYYNGSPGSGSDFFDTPPGVGTHNIDPFELGGHDEPASYGGSPGVSDGNAYANTQDVSPDGAHCPACGAQIEGNEKFCPYCGHKFR